MTRTHRRIHRLIWPILATAIVFGLAMTLKFRPPPDPPPVTEPRS